MISNKKFSLKKYKTGIVIQARTASKRFPKKILSRINGKTILEIMIERLIAYFNQEDIYIATTKESRDNAILKIAKNKKINIFRGSENNVLSRFKKCAEKNNLNQVIRLTSDCPLIDPQLIIRLFKIQLNKKFDYSGNCFPYDKRTFPVGSDIEFINLNFLKKISRKSLDNYEKEHITPYLNKKKFKTYLFNSKTNNSKLRYTLDYKEDLIVLKKIMSHLTTKKIFGTTNQIINFLKNNKNIIKLNSKHVANYYIKKLNQL
jgi:spore coat polysaccharide biosynthesis protein SpsF